MKKCAISLLKNWPMAVMMLGYMVIGGVAGFFGAAALFRDGSFGARLIASGLSLLLVALAVFAQIIAHELGHMLAGLMTGFRFSSFRVGSLMLVRSRGRFALKRFSIAGTGGQCLMIPPKDRTSTLPVMLYIFGGAAVNLILGIAMLAGGLASQPGTVQAFLMTGGVAGVVLAIQNGVPMHSDLLDNDGHNALALAKNPAALRAFYTQLDVNAAQTDGLTLSDMPANWTAYPGDDALSDPIRATLAVFHGNLLMEQHRFAEADALMVKLLSGKNAVNGLYKVLMKCDRAFIEMLGDNRAAVIDRLIDKPAQQIMRQMAAFPQVMRIQYALALLHDRDAAKAAAVLARFDKTAETYPFAGDIETERGLIALAKAKAADA